MDVEDDRDDLLNITDEEESLSEAEEHCLPGHKNDDIKLLLPIYENHTKTEFFALTLSLILSSTFVIILLPLYMESVNAKGDVYTMMLSTNVITIVFLFVLLLVTKHFYQTYRNLEIFKFPVQWTKVVQISLVYAVSGFMVIYALDRKRVMCHIQDAIKGTVLVFSLLYYFFFCRKLMGLQRIFSTTTIIVGLFISVDYGLCDEFKCRGLDRERRSDDAGEWSWQTHSVWTTIYICGLALFAAYFTLLDRFLLTPATVESPNIGISSFLSTVSRLVSNINNSNNGGSSNNPLISRSNSANTLQTHKALPALHLSFWIHLLGLLVILGLFWTDFIPSIGKGSGASDFFNLTTNGIICHFSLPQLSKPVTDDCANLSLYSWPFICVYIAFTLSSLRFLILSQSAVHTVATMAASLPLVSVWWSLFRMAPVRDGLLVWAPSVSGELICAILGLPVVALGLCFLCKSHFQDCQLSRMQASQGLSGSRYA